MRRLTWPPADAPPDAWVAAYADLIVAVDECYADDDRLLWQQLMMASAAADELVDDGRRQFSATGADVGGDAAKMTNRGGGRRTGAGSGPQEGDVRSLRRGRPVVAATIDLTQVVSSLRARARTYRTGTPQVLRAGPVGDRRGHYHVRPSRDRDGFFQLVLTAPRPMAWLVVIAAAGGQTCVPNLFLDREGRVRVRSLRGGESEPISIPSLLFNDVVLGFASDHDFLPDGTEPDNILQTLLGIAVPFLVVEARWEE